MKTELSARELLARCQEVERRMGRVPTEKWGPRIIDLDLLIYGEETIRDPDLVLPHPHIAERAFVLAPLMDIAPDVVIGGRSVRELYAAIDTAGVRPLPVRRQSAADVEPAALRKSDFKTPGGYLLEPSALKDAR